MQQSQENQGYEVRVLENIVYKRLTGHCIEDMFDLRLCFPLLVWTIRDFALELIIDDQPVTADEYLNKILLPLTV
jgi:hypothetical protein